MLVKSVFRKISREGYEKCLAGNRIRHNKHVLGFYSRRNAGMERNRTP